MAALEESGIKVVISLKYHVNWFLYYYDFQGA